MLKSEFGTVSRKRQHSRAGEISRIINPLCPGRVQPLRDRLEALRLWNGQPMDPSSPRLVGADKVRVRRSGIGTRLAPLSSERIFKSVRPPDATSRPDQSGLKLHRPFPYLDLSAGSERRPETRIGIEVSGHLQSYGISDSGMGWPESSKRTRLVCVSLVRRKGPTTKRFSPPLGLELRLRKAAGFAAT